MIRILKLFTCLILTYVVNGQSVTGIKKGNQTFEEVINTNFIEAKRIALKAVFESEKTQNDTLLLKSYSDLSKIYLNLKWLDSSLIYSNKALEYAIKLQHLEKEAILYVRKGKLARIHGDFKSSLTLHEKALRIAQVQNIYYLQADINNSLAILYKNKLDKKKSFKALDKSISISLLNNYQKGLSAAYNIKGLLFFNTHKDSVLHYYNKALNINRNNNNMFSESFVLSNIGDYYLSISDDEKAILALQEAERISKIVGNKTTLCFVDMSKAIYNEHIGRHDLSVKYYKKALNDYKKILSKKQRKRIYWLLSEALWDNGDYKEGFDYQEKYIYLNDSLFNIEKEKEFETLRTEYEVEKKDNHIILLKKENELAEVQQKWIIISVILLSIPLIGLFLFYRHRAKTQKTIRLQERKLHDKEKIHLEQEQKLKAHQALIEGRDKEGERIAKELHDGIGGQLAGIHLNLSHINSDINNSAISQINTSLKSTFTELRTLSHRLSYTYHKDKSFYSLLAELKEKYEQSKRFSLEITVYPEKSLETLHNTIKHNLYRIIQELLTNIIKHTKANEVQLTCNTHDDVLIVIVEDNGQGFQVNQQKEGIGLSNIKERIASMNGTLHIDSVIDKGTSVIIEIPTDKTENYED